MDAAELGAKNSLFSLPLRCPVRGVPENALGEPLDALGHPVASQPRGGQDHALPATDVVGIVREDRLHLPDAHAL